MVGVLILIDKDVSESSTVTLSHIGKQLHERDGRGDQVVEVEGVGSTQTSLVFAIHLRQNLFHGIGRATSEVVLVDQLILEIGHLVEQHPGRISLGVKVQISRDHAHEPLRV